MSDTNIPVSNETWSELNQRKTPGDSFDDVLKRLLAAAEGGDDNDDDDADDNADVREELADRVAVLDWSDAETAASPAREAALVDAVEVLVTAGICSRRTLQQIVIRSDRELELAKSSRRRMAADLLEQVDGVEPDGDSDLMWTG